MRASICPPAGGMLWLARRTPGFFCILGCRSLRLELWALGPFRGLLDTLKGARWVNSRMPGLRAHTRAHGFNLGSCLRFVGNRVLLTFRNWGGERRGFTAPVFGAW